MTFEYEVRESRRAKRAGITVYPDGRVVVTKPLRFPKIALEVFVRSQEAWVLRALMRLKKRHGGRPPEKLAKPRKGSKAYEEARKAARRLAEERLAHFSSLSGLSFGRISIRDQKTRWGSCSAKNDLSFNYRIAFLPPPLADYLVVHELCHTKEHNHSLRFWTLVAALCPDYSRLRKELRTRYSL